MVRQYRCAWLFASIVLVTVSSHAAVTVRIDRNTVQITDSFRVILETDQSVSDRPDFSPLQADFNVLGTSQKTNINFVNGKMRRSSSWTIDLMAKRTGMLTIPAIIIGREFSEPVNITVKAADTTPGGTASGDVQLEVEVDNRTPYVQGQVIYTVRLFRLVQIGNASLTEPRVTGGDVVVERLGDDFAYETRRDGKRVAVIERRYALFPQSSTKITIEPLLFEGRIVDNRSFGFGGRGRVVRVRSEAIEIEALPIPADFTGRTWLPARRLFLVESSPEGNREYRAGEPFTRTLTLQATGLGSSQLPEIGAMAPADIKQYPDQPVLKNRFGDDGLVANRQEKIALIPSSPGTFTLPAIEIPWWNTQTDQMEVAHLPTKTIEVLPALGVPADAQPTMPVTTGEQAAVAARPLPATAVSAGTNAWVWLSLALAIGWLATTLGWLWSRRRRAEKPATRKTPPTEKKLVAAINSTCSGNDADAAKHALLNWAARQWPGSRVHSLGDLAAHLDGDFQQQVHRLSQTLYSDSDQSWDEGALLWRAFNARQRERPLHKSPSEPELEPLYLQ